MTSYPKSNLNVLLQSLLSYEAFVLGHGPSNVASWLWPQIWLGRLLTSSLLYSDTSGPQLNGHWSVLLKSETCKNALLNCHRQNSLVNWKMKKKELPQGSDSLLGHDSVEITGVTEMSDWSGTVLKPVPCLALRNTGFAFSSCFMILPRQCWARGTSADLISCCYQ